MPKRTPETEAYLQDLKRTRGALLGVSRTLAIAGGVVLLGIAAALYRGAIPANMLLLPAGILALLGVGALLKGLTPERRIEPIDPQLLDKVHITTSSAPLTVRLGQFDIDTAADLQRRGASMEEIARSVCPGYDALGAFEQAAVTRAIEQALRTEPRAQ